MSRRIIIKGTEEILEVDLAHEVVREMSNQRGNLGFGRMSSLRFDAEKKNFVSEQDEDYLDKSILSEAERLYGLKLQKRREEQIEAKLKEEEYEVEKVKKDGKIKIIAEQRIYT